MFQFEEHSLVAGPAASLNWRENYVHLTILGCRAGMPADGQASSGYLVRRGSTAILLDAGPGIATALSQHLNPSELSAVFISHLHTDHLYDLLPLGKQLLAAATVYDQESGTARYEPVARVPLFVPAGARSKLDELSQVFPVATQPWLDRPFELAFEVIEYAPSDVFEVGGITLSLAELRHVAACCGVRLEADGASIVYSGDTGVTDALVTLAHGADILLCESTLEQTDPGAHGHMSSADAGRAAAGAGVSRLILTHFATARPESLDWHRAQASAFFGGAIDIAQPGLTVTLPTHNDQTRTSS
jgi:ribonuclease BN (tRNA processing enzyme)